MSRYVPDSRILNGAIGGYGPDPQLWEAVATIKERQTEMAEARNRATTDTRHALSVTEARIDEAVSVLTRKVADLEKRIAVRDANEVRVEALTQAVFLYPRRRRQPSPERVAAAAARFAAFLNTGH